MKTKFIKAKTDVNTLLKRNVDMFEKNANYYLLVRVLFNIFEYYVFFKIKIFLFRKIVVILKIERKPLFFEIVFV